MKIVATVAVNIAKIQKADNFILPPFKTIISHNKLKVKHKKNKSQPNPTLYIPQKNVLKTEHRLWKLWKTIKNPGKPWKTQPFWHNQLPAGLSNL
jgi:hypothetical protein